MRKFAEFVEQLSYEELNEISNDISAGSADIKDIVQEKIKERNRMYRKICVTCGSPVNLRVAAEYTIVFGQRDFKKKASFCGLDCMEYFVGKLVDMNTKKDRLKV